MIFNRTLVYISLCFCLLTGCTTTKLYNALPQKQEKNAQVLGFKNIRAWGDASSEAMDTSAKKSVQQIIKAHHGQLPKELNALALSGGGSDGAFGAGLLYGWSKTGTRPQFHLVSGISTGALIAPFAFLGPKYDKQLKEVYTTLNDEQIYEINHPFYILFSYIKPVLSPAVANNQPMKKVMKKFVTQRMLDEIAREHAKGRRLFVGTTQMNAQRLVIWDMGALASSKNPKALKLFQKILIASSALPGIFPPEYFTVINNGKVYKEMHMDGGVEAQVMLFEKALAPYARVSRIHSKDTVNRLYIIRNRKVNPEWEHVKPQLHSMLSRVVVTMTKTQGIGDLYRLYVYCLRDHIDYNLAYIPDNFVEIPKTPFDGDYMRKLFIVAEKAALRGYKWHNVPPGL